MLVKFADESGNAIASTTVLLAIPQVGEHVDITLRDLVGPPRRYIVKGFRWVINNEYSHVVVLVSQWTVE